MAFLGLPDQTRWQGIERSRLDPENLSLSKTITPLTPSLLPEYPHRFWFNMIYEYLSQH
jgi:hypothetical protein